MDYADYKHLTFEPKPNGVLLVTINRPEVLNAANARLHWEFTQVWLTVDADPKTRVVAARRERLTGAGDEDHPGLRVGVDREPDRGEIPVKARVRRVQHPRAVDGDEEHPVRLRLEREVLVVRVVHDVLLRRALGRGRRRSTRTSARPAPRAAARRAQRPPCVRTRAPVRTGRAG